MPEHQQIKQSTESKTTFQKQVTPIIQTPISNPMAIIQRARINPRSLTHADVMQLQRTIGNRAVGRLFSEIGLIPSTAKQSPPIQRQELVQKQEIPEEEEPLQGKMAETIQRQEIPEEEEPLQGKFESKPEIACSSCFASPIMQRQEIPEEEEPLQGKFETVQRQEIPEEEEPLQTKRENNTGMPDNLKAGVENLSGIDMSDVKVHYNSSKPAEVGALAYTQGTNIHVASGQEKHLPHEAWHLVQQAQDRVKPTIQLKNGVPVNDDKGLEREADVIGQKALQQDAQVTKPTENKSQSVLNGVSQKHSLGVSTFQFVDNQSETVAQRKLQEMASNSPEVKQLKAFQEMANNSTQQLPLQRKMTFGEGTKDLDASEKRNEITSSTYIKVQNKAKSIEPNIILALGAQSTAEQAKFHLYGSGGLINVRQLPDENDLDYRFTKSARMIAVAHETQHALDHLDPESPIKGIFNSITGKMGVRTELRAFAVQSAETSQLIEEGKDVERKLKDMKEAFVNSEPNNPTELLLDLMKYYAWNYSNKYREANPDFQKVKDDKKFVDTTKKYIEDYLPESKNIYLSLTSKSL